jgi:drug/metabolite transporter (DMT)-like permease
MTSAATATFLANNAPLWTGLGAMIFFKEKLSYNYWIGLCIALSASCLLMGKDVLLNVSPGKGAIFALVASVFYAAYLLTTQQVRVKVDTLKFMAISSIATSSVLLVYNVSTGYALTGFTPKTWIALLGIGLISHLGGWLCINYALGHLRASQVSISLLGQTVVTAILAIPILGENLSIGQIVGGVLVITGIYFVNKR